MMQLEDTSALATVGLSKTDAAVPDLQLREFPPAGQLTSRMRKS